MELEEQLNKDPFEEKLSVEMQLARKNLSKYQKLFMGLIGELKKLSEDSPNFQNPMDPKVQRYSEITFYLLNKVEEMSQYLDCVITSIQSVIVSYSRTLASEIVVINECKEIIGEKIMSRTVKRAQEYLTTKDKYSKELQEIIDGYDRLVKSVSEIAEEFDVELRNAIVMRWIIHNDNMTEDFFVEESTGRKEPRSPMYM